jgi:hypothetical protein
MYIPYRNTLIYVHYYIGARPVWFIFFSLPPWIITRTPEATTKEHRFRTAVVEDKSQWRNERQAVKSFQ